MKTANFKEIALAPRRPASPPGAGRPGGRAMCAPSSRVALDNAPAPRIIPAP